MRQPTSPWSNCCTPNTDPIGIEVHFPTWQGIICTDCAMWHANRDLSALSDTVAAAHVSRIHAHMSDPNWFVTVDSDADCSFDKGPCDSCGTHLAGDRMNATFISDN